MAIWLKFGHAKVLNPAPAIALWRQLDFRNSDDAADKRFQAALVPGPTARHFPKRIIGQSRPHESNNTRRCPP